MQCYSLVFKNWISSPALMQKFGENMLSRGDKKGVMNVQEFSSAVCQKASFFSVQTHTETQLIRRFQGFVSQSLLVSKAKSCQEGDSFASLWLPSSQFLLILSSCNGDRRNKRTREESHRKRKRGAITRNHNHKTSQS